MRQLLRKSSIVLLLSGVFFLGACATISGSATNKLEFGMTENEIVSTLNAEPDKVEFQRKEEAQFKILIYQTGFEGNDPRGDYTPIILKAGKLYGMGWNSYGELFDIKKGEIKIK